jgi:dephospho-CoA kinase
MIRVGLAGGIGSGKSGIAKCFEILGIPVYYSDENAKRIISEDRETKQALIKEFGKNLYIQNELQKEKLAETIFNNPSARLIVNEIVHPVVRKDFEQWTIESQAEIVIIESAIMFDTGFYKLLDKTILILAEQKQRINRVIKRDNLSEKSVIQRINAQRNPEDFKAIADFIIYNNDNDEVFPQIQYIINKLKKNG